MSNDTPAQNVPEEYGQTVADSLTRRPVRAALPEGQSSEEYGVTSINGRDSLSRGPIAVPAARSGSNFGGGFDGADAGITVVRELGRGGMGVVQLARDARLNRFIAVKRINAELLDNDTVVERFLSEARSAAALSHFHIIQIYGIEEDAEGPVIRMEYVAGPLPPAEGRDWPAGLPNPPLNLEEHVKRAGPLALPDAIRLVEDLCSGVALAHRAGIIHRDIKAANVLLTDEYRPKLADFGLARQEKQEVDAGNTMPGERLFTLGYGAPEQETDASTVDARADVYALGATLYFAATGQNPRHFRADDTPEPIRAIVLTAMSKDRERRYQTVKELQGELAKALSRAKMGGAASATSPGNRALEVGVCYACGHHHGGDADARKFCASCAAPLQTPCVGCKSPNQIWARFCGECGIDVMAAVKEMGEKFAAVQKTMTDWLAEFAIDACKNITGEMLDTVDPRLASYRDWAKIQREGPIRESEAAVRGVLTEAARNAGALEAKQTYSAAVGVIDALPMKLRERLKEPSISRSGGAAVVKLREQLTEKINRVEWLDVRIKSCIAADKYKELLAPAQELEGLRSDHSSIRIAREFVKRREAETEQKDYNAAMGSGGDGSSLPASCDNARAYLAAYASRLDLAGPRLEEVRQHFRVTLRSVALRRWSPDQDFRREYFLNRSTSQETADRFRARKILLSVLAVHALVFAGLLGFMIGGWISPWWMILTGIVMGLVLVGLQNGDSHDTWDLERPQVLTGVGGILFWVVITVIGGYEGWWQLHNAIWGGAIAVVVAFAVDWIALIDGKLATKIAARYLRPAMQTFFRLLVFNRDN
ncbi:MAG TPA: protein kinase [Tepidisphaeraceae bacterium]|jgi:serine/threonine protein kinase|nr:protein kinase [Tepidisphaeraceae bacterium]